MNRTEFLRARPTWIWLVLVALTAISVSAGDNHGTGSRIGVVVIVLAVVKVRFIGLDFMELRHAPRVLRMAFELYCVALLGVLGATYLWG
ncbi:MAG: hypothetical protein JWP74_1257 [Marmoricola sp.]|nr:hypothetical protein [Marmoricola sp.]